jgi:site-specific recombinase XerC
MGKLSSRRSHTVRVRLNDRARTAVAALVAVQGKMPGDALFTPKGRPHGAALTRKQFGRVVQGWAAELGLDPARYGSHTTRRSTLGAVYRATRDLRAVQLLAGHASITSTTSYLAVGVDDALDLGERHAL